MSEKESDIFGDIDFGKIAEEAKNRQLVRDSVKPSILEAIEKIEDAEKAMKSKNLSYRYQFELANARTGLFSILRDLDEEELEGDEASALAMFDYLDSETDS